MAGNHNGQFVLQTLESFEEPATLTAISKQIAEVVGVGLTEVKDAVKQTLDAGVRYGFIQRSKDKYFSEPISISDPLEEKVEEDKEKEDESNYQKQEDRTRKRRRKRRRSTSRRRRVSHKRRRY